MAYDTPKAAHFTATNGDGSPLHEYLTHDIRWLIAEKVGDKFPDLLGIKLSDIPRIREICENYSNQNIKITFNVPTYITHD